MRSEHGSGAFLARSLLVGRFAEVRECLTEAGAGVVSHFLDRWGVAELDHGLRVDGLDRGGGCILGAAHHDVAWEQCPHLRLCREGAAGQGGVAGAENDIVSDGVGGFGSELLLEGGADVDFGQDSEALLSQGVRVFSTTSDQGRATVAARVYVMVLLG